MTRSFTVFKNCNGYGGNGSWALRDVENGFLQEVGYTAKQDGPGAAQRQAILADVFPGVFICQIRSEILAKKWGKPNSVDRLRKIRNNINVALGTQKARGQPSAQAIEKWEADLAHRR